MRQTPLSISPHSYTSAGDLATDGPGFASSRTATYYAIFAHRRGGVYDDVLAQMLSSVRVGFSSMPDYLGLSRTQFIAMLNRHFPGYSVNHFARMKWHHENGFQQRLAVNADSLPKERYYSSTPLPFSRDDEIHDLRSLLLENRAGRSDSEYWLTDILIAGCLASDHLWRDLGLWQRKYLTEMMVSAFPSLAARNDMDMKWKKFLYKQLCESNGSYTCRMPSCEFCTDYLACYGPEE